MTSYTEIIVEKPASIYIYGILQMPSRANLYLSHLSSWELKALLKKLAMAALWCLDLNSWLSYQKSKGETTELPPFFFRLSTILPKIFRVMHFSHFPIAPHTV